MWRTVWSFLKKLKTELRYEPAIPLLGLYPEKMKILIQKDTCTSMFIVALSTIVKTYKQPKCPSTDEWIKMWCVCVCIYIYIYMQWILLGHKKNEILPCAKTWMDLKGIMLSEISQRKILYVITYLWNLKNKRNKQIQQNRNRFMDIDNKLVVTSREREGGRGKIGVGD